MTPLPGPAYQIVTQRLMIRCWNPSDAALLQAAIRENVDHLLPWMPWARNEPHETLEDKIARLRRWRARFDLGEDFIYGIFDQTETRVLGGTGLHTRVGPSAREIGYWIHKDFIKQGLATEVAAALTRVAFEIDQVQRIEIHCDPLNIPSAAVARKLGYTLDGIIRQRYPVDDQTWVDTMIWTLLKNEYPHSPSAQSEIEVYDAVGRRIL